MTLKWKSEFLAKKNNSLNVVYWHVVGILTWPAICCAARSFFNPVHYADNAVFFAELSRVNAMNPAKHTRIAMKIWTYTSENGKKNCMGRDWISAEKQIIITRLLARIFWENSHQKSLFILERLWIFIAPDRCETLKTSWTRLSQYFEYTFFSIRWRGLNILIFLPILGRTFSCEYS